MLYCTCRYEQLAEQEEQSYQQLRRKLYSEVQVEKDKLAVEANTKEEETMKELKEIKVCSKYSYNTAQYSTVQYSTVIILLSV